MTSRQLAFAAVIIRLARAIMPPERRNWADAMAHEFEALEADHLGFALGCFWSAILSNALNATRTTQLVLGGSAALFFGLTIYCAWFSYSWLPRYSDAPLPYQAAFVFGNLVVGAFSFVASIGATIALSRARDRVAMSVVGIRTISAMAFALAATFAGLAALNHWQGLHQSQFDSWAILGFVLYAGVGWLGFAKPDKLRMIGLAGLIVVALWPLVLQTLAIQSAFNNWAFLPWMATPLILLNLASLALQRLGATQHGN
ncbi:MAG: hypothetical protein CFE32_02585 [Alphaproteobacteria bacterium PA3]|nr:MAG: hypothetical protein CFE32_02585 [Alphaproteobacteria bacterium PA3]